jgi:hypothetical protein
MNGLYNKYNIQHANGLPVDPWACYFVLRYDENTVHGRCCRAALRKYAHDIYPTHPDLALNLLEKLREIEECIGSAL